MDEWDMNGERDLLGWSSNSFLLLFVSFCFAIYLIEIDDGACIRIGYEWMNGIRMDKGIVEMMG